MILEFLSKSNFGIDIIVMEPSPVLKECCFRFVYGR